MRLRLIAILLFQFVISSKAATPPVAEADPVRQRRDYRDFAMTREGDALRGRELFQNETRVACVKCHSVDGTSSKAGPDLYAIGDKFPRRELIAAVLEPSASRSEEHTSELQSTYV